MLKNGTKLSRAFCLPDNGKRTISALTAALLLTVAGFWAISGTAHATLIYDIQAEGPGSFGSVFAANGRIAFNALSGSDQSGLESFSFFGTGPFGSYSFDALDIRRLNWSIDRSGVLTLNTLDAAISEPGPNGVFTCLAIGSKGGSCDLPKFSFSFLTDFPAIGRSRGASHRATLGPVNGEPVFNVTTAAIGQEPPSRMSEPSGLGLFFIGLAGLVFAIRQGRQHERAAAQS